MSFLNPLVLLALAAAAIPLVIHLLNLRRPQKVDFSSLTFIKELQRSTMQRVKIKQWLLLALRTFALLFLILAFARPTLTGDLAGLWGGEGPAAMGVIVDASPSMALQRGADTPFQRAQEAARSVLQTMEQQDEAHVSSTGRAGGEASGFFQNSSAAQDAVGSFEVALNAEPASRTIQRVADRVASSENPSREVYLISDLQQSMLADTTTHSLPENVRVFLVPVSEGDAPANVAVTDVSVRSRIVEAGQPVEIEATLVNYGEATLEDYTASLYLGEERVAQSTTSLEPRLETTVAFTVTPEERGWLSGRVTIEDDDFAFDDERFFSLHVPEQRRLLLVEGQGQNSRFVRLALSAQEGEGAAAFSVDTISEQDLAATTLSEYDTIFLLGPRDLSSGEVADLTRYVENGGGVMLFPNEGARADDYNALLSQLNGGSFTGFSGSMGADNAVASFSRVDLEHPLFEGIFDERRGGVPGAEREIEQPELYYTMNYQPGEGTEQTLIDLTNQMPFLQEIRFERGSLLLMTVAPEPAWSDLPLRGLFVPLLYRSAQYLSVGTSVEGDKLVLGQAAELRLADAAASPPVELMAPDGESLIPEQRRVFGATLLQLEEEGATPGVYDVRQDDTLLRRVPFNMDARHSDLQRLSPEAAAETLSSTLGVPVQVLEMGDGGITGLSRELTAQRRGVELWNYFLLISLLFLAAEMVVARQWRPEAAT